MSEYVEIEDPKELSRLNRVLSKRLINSLAHDEIRVIGYPQGRFKAKVRFLSSDGADLLWWGHTKTDDNTVALNFFGHGTPEEKAWLNIDVQFNLPIVNFTRRSGGAFLRHTPTDTILLAHRGIVTLGHGRIQRSALFAEMAATLREADTSDGIHEFLLIAPLESQTLVDDIGEFATELRRTAKEIKANPETRMRQTTAGKARSMRAAAFGKLRKFFDEFSGRKEIKGRKTTVADCYHGPVVRALRDAIVNSAEVLKTREIDLVAITSDKAFIFEVKTSSNTQSIYTAVGQLMILAPIVTKHFDNLPLEKVIVLPEKPGDYLDSILTNRLGIRILTFSRSSNRRIKINGLKKLR